MLNSKEPMKVPHLQKLAKQLMLNGALIIKMINNSFTESRKTWLFNKAWNVLITIIKKMRYGQ